MDAREEEWMTDILSEIRGMRKDQQTFYQKWDEYTQDAKKEMDAGKALRNQIMRFQTAQTEAAEALNPDDVKDLVDQLKNIPNKEKLMEFATQFLKDKHREDDEWKEKLKGHKKE